MWLGKKSSMAASFPNVVSEEAARNKNFSQQLLASSKFATQKVAGTEHNDKKAIKPLHFKWMCTFARNKAGLGHAFQTTNQ